MKYRSLQYSYHQRISYHNKCDDNCTGDDGRISSSSLFYHRYHYQHHHHYPHKRRPVQRQLIRSGEKSPVKRTRFLYLFYSFKFNSILCFMLIMCFRGFFSTGYVSIHIESHGDDFSGLHKVFKIRDGVVIHYEDGLFSIVFSSPDRDKYFLFLTNGSSLSSLT